MYGYVHAYAYLYERKIQTIHVTAHIKIYTCISKNLSPKLNLSLIFQRLI